MSEPLENSLAVGIIAHAEMFRVRGLMDEALKILEKGLHQYPGEAGILFYQIGATHEDMGQYMDALKAFNQTIEILPSYYEGWVSRGVVYMRLGNEDEANSDFRKAIQVNPERFEAYANLGNNYRLAGAFSIAADHYKKALQVDGVGVAYPEIQLYLGWSYQHSGQVEEALLQYKVCLEEGSKNKHYKVNTLLSRSSLLQSIQSFDEALLDLEKADQLLPNSHTVLHRRGQLLVAMGRIDEALNDYQRAVELNSMCKQAVAELGLLNSKITLERLLSKAPHEHPVDP